MRRAVTFVPKEADILTPNQKSVNGEAVIFWRIANNCNLRNSSWTSFSRDLTTNDNKPSSYSNQIERKLGSLVLLIDLMTLFLF